MSVTLLPPAAPTPPLSSRATSARSREAHPDEPFDAVLSRTEGPAARDPDPATPSATTDTEPEEDAVADPEGHQDDVGTDLQPTPPLSAAPPAAADGRVPVPPPAHTATISDPTSVDTHLGTTGRPPVVPVATTPADDSLSAAPIEPGPSLDGDDATTTVAAPSSTSGGSPEATVAPDDPAPDTSSPEAVAQPSSVEAVPRPDGEHIVVATTVEPTNDDAVERTADDTDLPDTGSRQPAPAPIADQTNRAASAGSPRDTAVPAPTSASHALPDTDPRQDDLLARAELRRLMGGRSDLRIDVTTRELGDVTVAAIRGDGGLHLQLGADRPGARHELVQHLEQLRHDLAEQGVDVGSLDVGDHRDRRPTPSPSDTDRRHDPVRPPDTARPVLLPHHVDGVDLRL